MQENDIDHVVRLSEAIHPSLPESRGTQLQRLRLYPQGCYVLVSATEIQGYAFGHPIRENTPPALDTAPPAVPGDANQFYIHDVAVSERLRGGGYASIGINTLLALGDQYPSTALISVYGTTGFWEQFQFRESALPDPRKLLAYGEDAVFMVRRLDVLCD